MYGNLKTLKVQPIIITDLGGKQIEGVQAQLEMKIGNLPKQLCSVIYSGIRTVGIDTLKGLTLNLPDSWCQSEVNNYISAQANSYSERSIFYFFLKATCVNSSCS